MRQSVKKLVEILNANPQGCNQYGCKKGAGRTQASSRGMRRLGRAKIDLKKAETLSRTLSDGYLGIDDEESNFFREVIKEPGFDMDRALQAAKDPKVQAAGEDADTPKKFKAFLRKLGGIG